MKRNQKGFTVIETLAIILIICAIGFTGWYIRHSNNQNNSSQSNATQGTTSNWKTYANTCLNLTLKVPKDLEVHSPLPMKNGDCNYSSAGVSPNDVNYWAATAVTVGKVAVETVQRGPYISFGIPLPINNAVAMSFINLSTASSVSDLLNTYVTDKSNNANLSSIDGHKAATALQVNPNTPPANFHTVDRPYCPCATETILLDTGTGNVIPISADWLNSDKSSAAIIKSILASIKFAH